MVYFQEGRTISPPFYRTLVIFAFTVFHHSFQQAMMANTDPITRTYPLGKLYLSSYRRAQTSHMLQNTKPIAMKPQSNSLRNPLSIAKACTEFVSEKSVIATFHLNRQYHRCHQCFLLDKHKVTVPSKNQEFSKLEPKYRL